MMGRYAMSESHKVTYGFIREDRPSTEPGFDKSRTVSVSDFYGDGLDDWGGLPQDGIEYA